MQGAYAVSIAVLIVAAGRGTRAGGDVPKQYARIGDGPVYCRTIAAFAVLEEISAVQVVIRDGDDGIYWQGLLEAEFTPAQREKIRIPAIGGDTRQSSVFKGLLALASDPPGTPCPKPDLVLIHDAARPFVSAETIRAVIAALGTSPGAIAAVPLADTLKMASDRRTIARTVDRAGLWRAQTPQGFRFDDIFAAHGRAAAAGLKDFTDDSAVAEWAGLDVALVADTPDNSKITTASDLADAERRLAMTTTMEPRTGTGFDVHRFAPGDSVWLCGVEIPHEARLDGHSDADVGLHALTDAILGALGDGDIGQHFPPSDMRWKGAASHVFLADAARRVAERGGRISNVDVTLLCEAPKISPHRDAMRAAIAEILKLDVARVGVKATTTEGLGFTGRREGIAAMASATVMLPA